MEIAAFAAAEPATAQASEATATPAASQGPDLVAAAIKALGGDDEPADVSEPVPAEVVPEVAVAPVEPKESASALIRQRGEIERAARVFEAQRTKWLADQKEILARTEAMERAYAEFEANPVAFAKARGVKRPLSEIAKDFFVEEHAELLSPEQKAELAAQRERQQVRRELEEIKSQRSRAEAAQLLQGYRAHLVTGLSEITDATPLLKEMATQRPQAVADQMIQVADRLARERPDLGILSAKQIAEMLEPSLAAELAPVEGYFKRKYAAPEPKPTPVAPSPPSSTLKAMHSTQTSVRRPATTEAERIADAVRALEGRA